MRCASTSSLPKLIECSLFESVQRNGIRTDQMELLRTAGNDVLKL